MVKGLKGKESLILTGLGVIGVIGTGVSAALATPKALEVLEKKEDEEFERLLEEYEPGASLVFDKDDGLFNNYTMPTWRKALIIAPYYIPTALIAGATCTCIISSYVNSVKTQKSLIAAYTLVDGAYKAYRDKNVELYGEENDRQIRKSLAYGQFEDILVFDGETLFYDEYSGRYFKSTIEAVKDAEYKINRNFALRGYCELNELYEMLGIEPTDYGHTIGWNQYMGETQYGYTWIDFNHQLEETEDGLEYYVISYPFMPTSDFMY